MIQTDSTERNPPSPIIKLNFGLYPFEKLEEGP